MIEAECKRDPTADPFGEKATVACREYHLLLGGKFTFVTDDPGLQALVRTAFGNLPADRLPRSAPRLQVFLRLTADAPGRWRKNPPPMQFFAGAGLLGGAIDGSNLAIINPPARRALICVSPRMLAASHWARVELLEFVVYSLAARASGLSPLHAACVGHGRRGVLIVGNSGAGKSTLALHCGLQGLQILSEDSTLVSPRTLAATGLAAYLHVGKDSLHFIPSAQLRQMIRQAPVIRRRGGARKHEIDLRRTGLRLARAPLGICAMVFLSPRPARSGALLRRLSVERARDRLAHEQPYAVQQRGWSTMAASLGRVPAYVLGRGQHPDDAAQAIRALLVE